MEITTEKSDNVAIATLVGDHLDASNADEFKRDMAPLLEANPRLILDLSDVRFLDSAGLGALLSALRKLSADGGDLKLIGVSQPVRSVFQITRMHRIFDIFNTKEEALRAFES